MTTLGSYLGRSGMRYVVEKEPGSVWVRRVDPEDGDADILSPHYWPIEAAIDLGSHFAVLCAVLHDAGIGLMIHHRRDVVQQSRRMDLGDAVGWADHG